MKHKPLVISLGLLVLLIAGAGFFVYQQGAGAKADLKNPPKFIQAEFIDLSKIGSISKYRSGEGHDFSGNGETCRSMKHYYTPIARSNDAAKQANGEKELPPAPTPNTEIAIYSPVDGKITQISQEHTPIGEQIYIKADGYRGYNIRLFHIYKDPGIKAGMKVKAGQRIGSISELSGTDIAVEAGLFGRGGYVSYFDVMADSVFVAYQARGVGSRSDFIFTKEFRDAHPFKCNGEEFAENNTSDPNNDQDVYLNGWTPPSRDQQSGTTQPTQSGDNQQISAAHRQAMEASYPEIKSFFRQPGMAGQSVKTLPEGESVYYAFITFGSGLPIAKATCLRVDQSNQVTKIADFPSSQQNSAELTDVDPKTCRGFAGSST